MVQKIKYILQLAILTHLSFWNGIISILFEDRYINNMSIQVKRFPKAKKPEKAIKEYLEDMIKVND